LNGTVDCGGGIIVNVSIAFFKHGILRHKCCKHIHKL
jgi:hypothetical protein